jgi:enoyl-CoA hydratase/carnithine racemase
MTDPLVLSDPGRIWRVTLNRPEARNAVSAAMLGELEGALRTAAADPECRVVVMSGSGKDFCAGADVAELTDAAGGMAPAASYGGAVETLLRSIEELPRPVIAAVQGAALGAGCQIAVACDLVIAAEDARFGIPSARLGIVIGYESVERLARTIGPKRAGEMLLAARTVTGEEAVDWGLANLAVEPQALGRAVEELAARVAALAPLSVRASKRGLDGVLRSQGDDRGAREEFAALAASVLRSSDLIEGLGAFRQRRAPDFEGR